MRDVVPLIDINHPHCGLNKFLEKNTWKWQVIIFVASTMNECFKAILQHFICWEKIFLFLLRRDTNKEVNEILNNSYFASSDVHNSVQHFIVVIRSWEKDWKSDWKGSFSWLKAMNDKESYDCLFLEKYLYVCTHLSLNYSELYRVNYLAARKRTSFISPYID